MKPVIEVNDISKSYQISHQAKATYNTIKDDFEKLIRKPFGGAETDEIETFWALKEINFQVNQGEVFGIVGRNGSGKSTLLKILSRIVDPTTGTVKINGKVASLLEVGTGFHPELTGRENIYFNGSMIGMSKREIAKKFDEIIAFSEVEQFLDTPVKFYSSGMYVRLAFSVAAHLDSEILIIDEVLSVGDTAFQKKSLNKMMDITKSGRTILFVSHSMSAVEMLCKRALLLKHGKIHALGDTEKIVESYLGKKGEEGLTPQDRDIVRIGRELEEQKVAQSQDISIESLRILGYNGQEGEEFDITKALTVELIYKINKPVDHTFITCNFYEVDGPALFATTDCDKNDGQFLAERTPGTYIAAIKLPAYSFTPRRIYVIASAQKPNKHVLSRSEAVYFQIYANCDDYMREQFAGGSMSDFGYSAYPYEWDVKRER